MGELEAIRRRHLLETADGNCAGSYSWDPEGWYRPQGHDLDLAVEDIGKLLAELEREVTHSEALGDEIGDLQEEVERLRELVTAAVHVMDTERFDDWVLRARAAVPEIDEWYQEDPSRE